MARDRAILAKDPKTSGLDVDCPAAAGLNQPNGAALFLLLSVRPHLEHRIGQIIGIEKLYELRCLVSLIP